MVVDHEITSVDGRPLAMNPGSICVHGDTDGAVQIARRVRAALAEAGVSLEPFASGDR
jgi:UPF0271 protein